MIGLDAWNPEGFRVIANQEGKPVKIRYGPATVMPFYLISSIVYFVAGKACNIAHRTSKLIMSCSNKSVPMIKTWLSQVTSLHEYASAWKSELLAEMCNETGC